MWVRRASRSEGMGMVLVFRKEGELNSLRGGKGGALAKFGGGSKRIKGRFRVIVD